jgi:flavin reductase (DIM6/NTAB) family NADH-FMN oxidoreductase RutF
VSRPDPAATFPQIAGDLDYPMVVVTTVAGDERAGCLVGFTTQCSIHPPRFLICLSDKNRTTRLAARADALAVHVLGPQHTGLAELFGSETSDDVDKFAHCRWHSGPDGLPILDDCPRWFAGRILERLPCGDHIAHLLEVTVAEHGAGGPIYTFQRAREIEPGHEA